MIKKLQIKLILLTMVALLALLSVIVVSMNLINYNTVVAEADRTLALLSGHRGQFPDHTEEPHLPDMSPEMPYESRYFSVLLGKNNEILQVDTGRIKAVDTGQAIDYAAKVAAGSADSGFADAYRFLRTQEGPAVRITFLDLGRNMDAVRTFLIISCSISLAGLGLFFFVVLFFSNRIVRPVAESYEKQKQFITDAGHELKTPLTIIQADADVLEMELGDNEWLQDIQLQTKRLTGLTNDLVYLSRMEEGSDTMAMIEFSVSDLVAEAAASFKAPAQTQGKSFHCDIQPMLSLCGNEKAIGQLVGILLDNALKYSPEGGAISLALERQAKAILLSVKNTTAGSVAKEDLSRMFERFYRMDQSRNAGTGGYGIGLSVARAIVHAHNGKIGARAETENSLQIMVTLPI